MSGEEPIRPSSQNFLLNKNALIQLQNNDPALTSLTVGVDLHFYEMSETDGFVPHENDWGKLGRFIGRNTHITELRFGNLGGYTNFNSETRELDEEFMFGGGSSSDRVYPPTLEQFKEFCSGLADNTSVKKVDFIDAPEIQGYRLQRTGWGIAYLVMSGWFQNDVIEEISMPVCTCEDGNYDNSIESSKMATVLATKFSSLKKFYIEFDGDIHGDESEPCEVSADIINALVNHTNLEDLSLSHGRKSWSREGYAALARFLSNSKVKELQLSGGNMSDEGVQAIAGALGENDTLKEIIFGGSWGDYGITSTGWKAFSTLLSNPASVMDTYYSNHTIQKLLHTWYSEDEERETRLQKSILGDELYSLLRVNRLCNKSDAARVKIILRHLSEDFSMEPFAGMNVATMPYALAWMGKSNPDIASLYPFADADLCLMYKFVRGVAPVLFEASPSAGSKRKISSEPE